MKPLIFLFGLSSFVEGVTVFQDRVFVGSGIFGDSGELGVTIMHDDFSSDATSFRLIDPLSETPFSFGPEDTSPLNSRTTLSSVEDGFTIALGIEWVVPAEETLLTAESFFESPVLLGFGNPTEFGRVSLLGRDTLTLGFLTAAGDTSFGTPAGIGWVRFDVEPSMGDAVLNGPLQLTFVDSAWVPANFGIFSGTLNTVPEPSGLFFAGVSLISLVSRRRRADC